MKRIIVISDINGYINYEWFNKFEGEYKIQFFSVLELAGINTQSFNTMEERHYQLVNNGGIERAIKALLNTIDFPVAMAFGFSIGGLVLWKAIFNKLQVEGLYCFSTTRLRYEIEKPDCYIKVIFGTNDPYIPNEEWCNQLEIDYYYIVNEGHEFYKKLEFDFLKYLT